MSDRPADVPPGGGTHGGGRPATQAYAGLGPRFVARLIDGILVSVSVSIILGILPGVSPGGVVGGVVGGLAALAYFVVMETSRGATVGKMLLRLKVADADGGSAVSTDASFRRNAWMLLGVLSGVPFFGWLAALVSLAAVVVIAVTISGDERKQGLHDQVAHTVVLEVR